LTFSIRQKAFSVRLWAFSLFIFLSAVKTTEAQDPALRQLLESKELKSANVGVYVFDDSSKKIIADHQSDKYFVPASNTKLFTLYTAMILMGFDSLLGLGYHEIDTAIFIYPTGDPTFLHPDYASQPVFDFLRKTKKKIYFVDGGFNETPWGPGWAWDDFNDDYAVERSQFPIYGNFIRWNQQNSTTPGNKAFAPTATISGSPEVPWKVRFSRDSVPKTFLVKRLIDSNVFVVRTGTEPDISQDVPFITNNLEAVLELLPDTLGKPVHISKQLINNRAAAPALMEIPKITRLDSAPDIYFIYSQPADSVYIPMMHRSDNFFAEQLLLMVSNITLGYMNDQKIIDYTLNRVFFDLPQKPNWVDGSGLSRYNLFSPQDFVTLLIKFKNEFGMERMKRILPTGGKGSLKNYYHADSNYVFAKTGSMSGVICISGYIYTSKKHLLEFSILVNNNNGGGSAIRREIENYIEYLRKNN
jgi:serine-type D-Ala-D-Ala carboxypeptidase/endopeptidase (penicillin-binding protein 4)